MNDFTIVVGLDARHLEQFRITHPTWVKNKSSLLKRKLIVFYDRNELDPSDLIDVIGGHEEIQTVPWPPKGVEYKRKGEDRFGDPHRVMMLSGFVHVPAAFVKTPYWLKIDTDAIAVERDDWIDPTWLDGKNAIVSHGWGFTRPPGQMLDLDKWVREECNGFDIALTEPLNLIPEPGADRLRHKRITSWCSFQLASFTKRCAYVAESTMGRGHLPVPSQDGYSWYVATRLGLPIVTTSMKKRGWAQWHTDYNVRVHAAEAMKNG